MVCMTYKNTSFLLESKQEFLSGGRGKSDLIFTFSEHYLICVVKDIGVVVVGERGTNQKEQDQNVIVV